MLINYFISCVISAVTAIYIIKRLLKVKINYKSYKIYACFVSLVFLMLANYSYINGYLSFFVNTFYLIVIMIYLFNNVKVNNVIIVTIIEQLILFLSELIFSIFIIVLIKNNNSFLIDIRGSLIANIIICSIALLLINIKIVYIISLKIFDLMAKYNKYFLSILVVATLNILLYSIYNNISNYLVVCANIFFISVYSYIAYLFLYEKNRNNVYMEENKLLIKNLNEYEKMLDYQRVNNHENKNQLLVIKSMIEKNDKKLMEYVNEIIKEKREDNEIIYNKAKRIPSGGLQGLIYQKMLLMQEKNIEIILDIDNQVRKIDFGKLSSKMNYDICRIAGIIIDNAIEETVKFNKKEREIIISMYVDDEFVIEISNRFKNDLDLNKIYEKGYTSKSKGHGYGLSLLKKIVDENEKITNDIKIVNNIFTQIIKIKM